MEFVAAVVGTMFVSAWSAVAVGWAMGDATATSGTFASAPIVRVARANPLYWLTLWLFTSKDRYK